MRRFSAWPVLALLVLTVPARANTVIQGSATIAAGYNSNPTGTPVARGAFFYEVRPGLRLTSLFERGLFYAQYTFDVTQYLGQGAGSGFSNDLSVGALLVTSRTTSLTLSAGVLQSQFNNLQALQVSAAAPVNITPGGTSQFVSARASESVNWDFTHAWHLSETSTFSTIVPLSAEQRPSYDLNNLVEIGRGWQRDNLSLLLRVDYVHVQSATLSGIATNQLLDAASARWLHDFGSFFSTEIMAGILFAMRANDGGGLFWTPIGRAALHYRRQEGSVDLSFDHSVEASLLSGATYLNDTLALRGGLPLGRTTNMALGASLAFLHGAVYDATAGRLTGSNDVWLADLGWTWSPWRELSFFARYSFTDQIGTPTDPVPVQSFMRHLVVAGINIVYPAEAVAPVGFRDSVRADRSDAVTLPALHAPPPR